MKKQELILLKSLKNKISKNISLVSKKELNIFWKLADKADKENLKY